MVPGILGDALSTLPLSESGALASTVFNLLLEIAAFITDEELPSPASASSSSRAYFGKGGVKSKSPSSIVVLSLSWDT